MCLKSVKMCLKSVKMCLNSSKFMKIHQNSWFSEKFIIFWEISIFRYDSFVSEFREKHRIWVKTPNLSKNTDLSKNTEWTVFGSSRCIQKEPGELVTAVGTPWCTACSHGGSTAARHGGHGVPGVMGWYGHGTDPRVLRGTAPGVRWFSDKFDDFSDSQTVS